MKTLILAGFGLAFSQTACAAKSDLTTGGAPILETVTGPETILFTGFGKTAHDIVAEDLKITEDNTIAVECGRAVEDIIAEDLRITEAVIDPIKPLDTLRKDGKKLDVRETRRLLGSL